MQREKSLARTLVSQWMREKRRSLEWSQESMSECLCISLRAYGDLERGKYRCSSVTLLRFLNLLGKDKCWELVTMLCELFDASAENSTALQS